MLGIANTAVYPPRAAAARTGLDRLRVLPTRLAQVGVQVDQPGQHDKPVAVDDLGGRGAFVASRRGAGGGNHAVREQQVTGSSP